MWWAKRRLFCAEPACTRKAFAESTPQVPRFARSTPRLKDAVVSSGRAASEVADPLGVPWWLVNAVVLAAAAALPSADSTRRLLLRDYDTLSDAGKKRHR
ncbi:hypothetical protein GCM10009611_29070 [Arthrobacter roseus]